MAKAPYRLPRNWQKYAAKGSTSSIPWLADFYAQMPTDPAQTIGQTRFVAMDFETTGLDAARCSIVSVGLVPFSWQRIYCRQAKHFLIQPEQPLTSESVVIHGITHSDLAQAPTMTQMLPKLLGYLSGYIPVVHYRQIERDFLWHACQQQTGEALLFPLIDTMHLEHELQRTRRFWPGTRGESLRLADCRTRYHLPHYPLHNALSDALATAELLQAQLQHHFMEGTPISKLWC